MNSYMKITLWIHSILWIHIHEFRYHEFIVSYSYMNSYAMNSFKDIHIWIHEQLNSYMNSTLWIHERLQLNKRLHATCLATSNLPMLSSSSGITNCSKVFTLPFILPIPAMLCRQLIHSHTHISGWHLLATRCDWSWLISSTQRILCCLCKLQLTQQAWSCQM